MASLASSMSGSRSPSPDTPEADTDSMFSPGDLQSWLKPAFQSWDIDPSLFAQQDKDGEVDMMRLDELIERTAYQDSTIEPFALQTHSTDTNAPTATLPNPVLSIPILSRRPATLASAPKTVFPTRESCYK